MMPVWNVSHSWKNKGKVYQKKKKTLPKIKQGKNNKNVKIVSENGAQPVRVQSEPKTSPLHQVPTGFAGNTAAAPQRTKTNQSQPVSPALPSPPFFSNFSLLFPPHHFITPSLLTHTPPAASLSLSVSLFLCWAI